jgi:hypothetical protein
MKPFICSGVLKINGSFCKSVFTVTYIAPEFTTERLSVKPCAALVHEDGLPEHVYPVYMAHVLEHPSKSNTPPSSQPYPASITPSPHTVVGITTFLTHTDGSPLHVYWFSTWQLAEHPSLPALFSSSHCSAP